MKYIQSDDSSYVSAGIDYNDFQKVVDESLASLFATRFFKNISLDSPLVLAVSDFINDTTLKFSVEQISTRMIEGLQASGKFQVTRALSGSGGYTEGIIDDTRTKRGDGEFNQKSVAKSGKLLALKVALNARITQEIAKVGKDQRVDYFFRVEA